MADDEGAVIEAPRRHWVQDYRGLALSVDRALGSVWVLQCDGCGSLVGDRERHNEWHRVTRSVVSDEG